MTITRAPTRQFARVVGVIVLRNNTHTRSSRAFQTTIDYSAGVRVFLSHTTPQTWYTDSEAGLV